MFEMLAGKERKSAKSEKVDVQLNDAETLVSKDASSEIVEGEDSTWTVQSSVKTRRLVPQFSLSRQDLGSDNVRSKVVPIVDPIKKKVIRFTKEEMLSLRKPSKILSSMSDMLEMVSLTTQDPVCFEKLDPDDVLRIWNNSENRNNKDVGGRGGRGRGGRVSTRQGDEHQQNGSDVAVIPANDWTRNPAKGGLWDGGEGPAGGLDLADFAAAALKFRTEMADMKFADEGGAAPEDMMERLLREQTYAANGDEDDEDAMPDWAADNDDSISTSTLKTGLGVSSAELQQPTAKRSLLLETLNVKTIASTAGVRLSTPVVSVAAQNPSYNLQANEQVSRVPQVAPPPPQMEPEWFYTDPQQQVQGPFSQENMKLWHEAGYFSKDLPVKLRQWSGFHAFYLVFPDLVHAFTFVPSEVRPNFPSMPALSSVHSLEHLHALEQQRLQEQRVQEQQRQQQEQQRQQFVREQQLFEQRQAEEAHKQQQFEQQLQKQRVAEQQAAADAARRSRDVRVNVSGPPPLTPVTLDNKLLPQQRGTTSVSVTTPPPLDSLRKIRISNIEDLTSTPITAVVTEVPKKTNATNGPPPLAQDRSRDTSTTSSAPWAASAASSKSVGNKESLVAIQNVEKEKAFEKARETELKQSKANKNWTSSAASKPQSSASLAEIQEEESRHREHQRALTEARQPAAAPLTMSSQLKSLLGVRPSGNGAVNAASPLAPKQWADSGVAAPSLRDIMQQEEKQTVPADGPIVSGGSTRKQPLSWAAKASTGVNATNLLPVPSAGQIKEYQTSVPTKAPQKPVAVAAPSKQRGDISVGADFGGKGMSREMSEWCSAQLRKITNADTDNSALMEFCSSLDSASEIREYLSQYLGSSPQLTNFATDFIKYKEGGKKALLLTGDTQSSSGANSDSRSKSNQGFTSATNNKKKKPTTVLTK